MASIRKRIAKSGKVTYTVQIRRKGADKRTKTFDRKTDAKNWAEDQEAEIRQGRDFKYAEANKHTVGEAIDHYIGTVLPRKSKSACIQGPQLIRWREEIGQTLLADLHPPLIVKCRDQLVEETIPGGTKRSSGTVNRYLAAFSHVITVAMKEWGWIDHNPVLAVAKLKEAKGRIRYLSHEERARLLEACKNSRNQHLFEIVVMAIATGMRKQEILSLTWDNVNLESGVAYLFETKNSEPRAVPLGDLVRGLLIDLRRKRSNVTGLVFPSPNGNRPIDIRSAWEKARKRAGLIDFRFHDLRHTAGSYLAMSGASLPEIAAVLGHKSYDMVKRYAHLSDQHTASVVERMNQKVFGGGDT